MWFMPNSALTPDQLRKMPTEVASRMPDAYLRVVQHIAGTCIGNPVEIEDLLCNKQVREASERIGSLFRKFGSDKSTKHNYHVVYGAIMCGLSAPIKILEIGLGTNNTGIASNMGVNGKPGASLRAFKEFSPQSTVYGADIDESIKVDGCEVFVVDQTNHESFESIRRNSGPNYDLIIDDGLHSPDANLNTLLFGLKHVSQRGCVVIEDIPESALPIWKSIQYAFLNSRYKSTIFKARAAYMFVVSPDPNILSL